MKFFDARTEVLRVGQASLFVSYCARIWHAVTEALLKRGCLFIAKASYLRNTLVTKALHMCVFCGIQDDILHHGVVAR